MKVRWTSKFLSRCLWMLFGRAVRIMQQPDRCTLDEALWLMKLHELSSDRPRVRSVSFDEPLDTYMSGQLHLNQALT